MNLGFPLWAPEVWPVFCKPGEVTEVRILRAFGKSVAWGGEFAKGIVSGYFDDREALAKAVTTADKERHGGIYFTLQIIDPRLSGRAFNRLKPSDLTTADTNVLSYRWLPIDLDPIRPAGISSSDAELTEALELRELVAAWVIGELSFPVPIRAMSGNGGHLLFRIPDIPVTKDSQGFLKNVLEGIACRFSSSRVKLDVSVFNPSRIWKLYGTVAQKGDSVPAGPHREARPHRRSYIEDLGAQGK
jgi:hypothetical protein